MNGNKDSDIIMKENTSINHLQHCSIHSNMEFWNNSIPSIHIPSPKHVPNMSKTRRRPLGDISNLSRNLEDSLYSADISNVSGNHLFGIIFLSIVIVF